MSVRWGVIAAFACCLGSMGDVRGQELQIETRVGFLVTFAEGHTDRPLATMDVGFAILEPKTGAPGLTLTGGASVGFADFFADVQSESLRLMGGVEVPWSVAATSLGRMPIAIVPHLEAGYLDSNGGDGRSGMVWRAGVGLRVPVGAGNMHFTFEPLALVRLPEADVVAALDQPLQLSGLSDSRLGLEFGVLSLGWRF